LENITKQKKQIIEQTTNYNKNQITETTTNSDIPTDLETKKQPPVIVDNNQKDERNSKRKEDKQSEKTNVQTKATNSNIKVTDRESERTSTATVVELNTVEEESHNKEQICQEIDKKQDEESDEEETHQCNVDHFDLSILRQVTLSTWFKEGKRYYNVACEKCSATIIKASTSKPVYVCPNEVHGCTATICNTCMRNLVVGENESSSSKRRRI